MPADPSRDDAPEDLLAEALLVLEQRGEEGLQELLTNHADDADAIRIGLERLRRMGMLAPPPAAVGAEARQFGEFRVLRRLATGGMGVVYLAEQISLQRQVALKAVRAELLQSPTARERFQREVEAVARLQHPGIVPILAVGDENGQPWFAMEYVEGRTLEQLLQAVPAGGGTKTGGGVLQKAFGDLAGPGSGSGHSGPFAGSYWEACTRLVLQVAQTLTYVHARGIVHRDLKPSNVVVTPHGQALVLDFGLAHVQDLSRMTRSESQVGSPAYMAPEQVRGEAIDERVDVYGLAVTLYQLLTTQLPFAGDSNRALEAAILEGAAKPLRAHQRALPKDLEIVVTVAMDRDRARRYGSMAALAADLEAVLARRPIAARPVGPWLRAVRLAQRHPVWTTVLAAVVVLALQFPLVLWRQQAASNRELTALNLELERQRGIAEGARTLAEADYRDALATIYSMLVHTGQDDLVTAPGSEHLRIELLERAVALYERLGTRRGADQALALEHARALQFLGAMQQAVGNTPGAEDRWREALALLVDVNTTDATLLAGSVHKLLGQSALSRGAITEADALLSQALCELRSTTTLTPDDRVARRQTAEAQNSLAIVHRDAGDGAGWRRLLREAHASKAAMLAETPRDLEAALAFAISCDNLSEVNEADRDHDAAIRQLSEGIDRMTDLHPDTAHSQVYRARLANLFDRRASICQDLRRLAEAERDHGMAYALREELRREFPDTAEYVNKAASSLHNLARTLSDAQRVTEAMPLQVESVSLHHQAVHMAPQRQVYKQHLEYALVSLCAMQIDRKDWAALATTTDELEAAAVSTEGWLNAARIRVLNAGKIAAADAAGATHLRDRAARDVGNAVDLGFADLDHFERGNFARLYKQLDGLAAYDQALAKLRSRRGGH